MLLLLTWLPGIYTTTSGSGVQCLTARWSRRPAGL